MRKKIMCIFLSMCLLLSNCIPVYAETKELSVGEYIKGYATEFGKLCMVLACDANALIHGDYTAIVENAKTYLEQAGTGTFKPIKIDDNGGVTYPEDLIQALLDYFNSLKDEDGNYDDENIKPSKYKWVKTVPFSEFWAHYLPTDSDVKIPGTTLYGSESMLGIDELFSLYKENFKTVKEPNWFFIRSSANARLIFMDNVTLPAETESEYETYFMGSVNEGGTYSISYCVYDRINHTTAVRAMPNTAMYRYFLSNYGGTYTSGFAGGTMIITVSKYDTDFGITDGVLPALATSDGRWVRVFETPEDAKNYFDYMDELGLNDAGKYTGGDVYINNGTIYYGGAPADDGGDDDGDDDSGGGFGGGGSSISNVLLQDMVELLEDIKKKLNSIYNQLVLGNIISGLDLLLDAFNSLMDGAEDAVESVALVAESKFPFSIPFDIYLFLSLMEAEPVAPKFEIPFKYSRDGCVIDETVVVDLEKFTMAVEYCRYLTLFLYIWGLLMLTLRMVNVGKGDS